MTAAWRDVTKDPKLARSSVARTRGKGDASVEISKLERTRSGKNERGSFISPKMTLGCEAYFLASLDQRSANFEEQEQRRKVSVESCDPLQRIKT